MGTRRGDKSSKKDDRDHRRGRSRDPRSSKASAEAEAPQKKEKKHEARSRSRPRLRAAADVPSGGPPKSSKEAGKDHGHGEKGKDKSTDHVSLESSEEDYESETPRADDEEAEPGPAAAEESTPAVQPLVAVEVPAPEAGQGEAEQGKPVGGEARPRSPDQGPEKSAKTSKDKHGKFQCQVCGRTVGGGLSGSFQHKRSPYHLSCWVYYKTRAEGGDRSWKDCQTDGERWSRLLWQENKTGPAELDSVAGTTKQTPPAPIRSDPERKKRDGPGGPDKGPGSGPSSASGSSTLLVEMWQATLRELKG